VKKPITIPLTEFAQPVPRSGSIDAHSGFGRAAAEGREIHAKVQRRRSKADSQYQAEVAVSCRFERDGYLFLVEGRMDGIFRHEVPKIEEIKSGLNVRGLACRLADDPVGHPYGLQLLSYGYFHLQEHGVQPTLSFHLVSTRSNDCEDLEVALDPCRYEQWLELRLAELVAEARRTERRSARRRKVAADFRFPFSTPRQGQPELMREIELGMAQGVPMLIQAPTGLGKTAGVLYPVLREALARGRNVVYVTPKNSQHSVAEDAVARFQETGHRVKSLSITAKAKICFKGEPLCNPDFCEYARDYYAKLQRHGVTELLAKKRKLTARVFRSLGEKYQLCPFELQIDGAGEADVIICDYNYVFAPRSALGRVTELAVDQAGKPNLVIDEVHNLPARAMECYSPLLSTLTLEKMRDEIRLLPDRFQREAEELLDGCIRMVASCLREGDLKPRQIAPPTERFLEQDGRLRAFLARYLDSEVEIRNQDVVLRLCFYWSDFAETLETAGDPGRQEFFVTSQPHPTGGLVKVTCCDASAMLKDCYGQYDQVVGFSATLKPFEYYVRLSGLDSGKVRTAEFGSPFPRERRKLLIIPQVSTRYRQRERQYARIADAVRRITALRRGNYFVFLPSFEFLERVAECFQATDGFMVGRQERGMRETQVEEMLEQLRSCSVPTIVFAVQGGSFSEGVDYAGEMVIGAFVVGPPLPGYDLERELMKTYYQRRYGAGFDYAYVIPAMAKAVQAAGRVIRSETDRGLIVLMDGRFLEPGYSRAMPADWFDADAAELVSDSILHDISEFWEKC